MRVLIQRVTEASVTIKDVRKAEIGKGFLVLVGITETDSQREVDYLARKILALRVFEDEEGKMNRSLVDVGGGILVVSQFTLYGDTQKGNRPSFIKAARPEQAIPLYESFISLLQKSGLRVETGEFGADMAVALVNDGPVTIWIDSSEKFG